MKKLKGSIRITRPQCSTGEEIISIRIEDELSATAFLDIEMSYRDFVIALTSGNGEMEFTARGIENVGKRHECEKFTFPFEAHEPYSTRDERAYAEGLKHCPEGWTMDNYFGSRSSFGQGFAQATIRRWVEVEEVNS